MPSLLLLSVVPGISSRPGPVSAPRQARQKPIPQAAAPESQNRGPMAQGCLSFPRETWGAGSFLSQSHGTVLGGATNFPTSSNEADLPRGRFFTGSESLTKGAGPWMVAERNSP